MFFDVSLAICRGLCYRKVSIILTIFLSPISNYILLLLGTGKLSYECGNNADTAFNTRYINIPISQNKIRDISTTGKKI